MASADRPAPRGRTERGTSTLEVVGLVPIVLLVVMLLVQASLALYAVTTGQTAVRQAARAASLGEGTPVQVINSSVPSWLQVSASDVELVPGPGHHVRARFDIPDVVPGFDLAFTRESVMP